MDAGHIISRTLAAGAAVLGLAILSPLNFSTAAESYSEDAVKAAYLYRFAGYIDWPGQGSVNDAFVIEVLGSPGIARELRRLLANHRIHNRLAEVHEVTSSRDFGPAQIAYVGPGHADLLRTLAPAADRPSILLVTDEEGGLTTGGTLNFLTIDRNVRFEVSMTAADRWGLKISSELLGVAVRVQGSGRQTNVNCLWLQISEIFDVPCEARTAYQLSRRPLPAAHLRE
jgi:hypothetical protein